MHIGYVLAVAILDGEVLPEQFSPARLDADDVWELIPRITSHHNPDFDNDPNDHGKTILRIRFTDGQVIESVQQAARSILSPLTNDEITAKYRDLTEDEIDPIASTNSNNSSSQSTPPRTCTSSKSALADPFTSPFEATSLTRGCVTIPQSARYATGGPKSRAAGPELRECSHSPSSRLKVKLGRRHATALVSAQSASGDLCLASASLHQSGSMALLYSCNSRAGASPASARRHQSSTASATWLVVTASDARR